MHKFLMCFALLCLLSGCAVNAPTPGQRSAATKSVTRIPIVSPTPRALASSTAPVKANSPAPFATPDMPEITRTAGMPLVLSQTSGGLTVQVFSDTDVEVSDPKYLVSGRAPSGTVLSINDEIIVVDQSQAFSTLVSLEDGPNLIEIVASDAEGNEVSFMLTVSYSNQS